MCHIIDNHIIMLPKQKRSPAIDYNTHELTDSASSSGNVLFHRLPSRAKTEALNPHHHHRPPSSDSLTHTLYCYKKVISTLITLFTIQPRLYFAFSQARVPHHRSSTRRYHSLSPPSHVTHPSIQ
jgi:hypothetical protein